MAPRPKKYQLVVNLSELDIKENVLSLIEEDFNNGTRELANSYYTITTSGGSGSVWKVHEKDKILYTISTDSIGKVKVNPYVTVNKYKHYVLTAEGIELIKSLVVEHAI